MYGNCDVCGERFGFGYPSCEHIKQQEVAMNRNILLDKIIECSNEIDRLEKLRIEHIKDIINECDHPETEVFEKSYVPETSVSYSRPPIKVCRICGQAEEGWGVGYKIFNNDEAPIISDSKYWEYVRVLKEQNGDETIYDKVRNVYHKKRIW